MSQKVLKQVTVIVITFLALSTLTFLVEAIGNNLGAWSVGEVVKTNYEFSLKFTWLIGFLSCLGASVILLFELDNKK